jgi:adenosylcobinamide kinase/adenosylcobinamide-phosphate guanylyltransferase
MFISRRLQEMKRFTFILGGARSGKSGYAVDVARSIGRNVVFIATCIPQDAEMNGRIRLHKRARPSTWILIEEGIDIDAALRKIKMGCDAVLIDCIGFFISNLMAVERSDKKAENKINLVIEQIEKMAADVIVVSNEVGMGIVPDNPLARRFRDLLGRANQMLARSADRVIVMQSGIPVTIKGGDDAAAARYDTKNQRT